jgi:uncharacterized protein (TIGR02271 family)
MRSGSDDERASDNSRETVIPLLAEEVAVGKRRIETGRVRIERITHAREQLVDEALARETVEIERVPIDRRVDAMPAVREEGDTTIIPIVEEVLVVERRLLLKEEVRIRRVRSTERHRESVTLRRQEAVVTRLPAEAPEGEANPAPDTTTQSTRRG